MNTKLAWLGIVLLLAGCATNTHSGRPAVKPDQVEVYFAIPEGGEVVGKVSAKLEKDMTLVRLHQDVLQHLQKRCARLRANGLVVHWQDADLWKLKKVSGDAVYVRK